MYETQSSGERIRAAVMGGREGGADLKPEGQRRTEGDSLAAQSRGHVPGAPAHTGAGRTHRILGPALDLLN